MEVFKICKEEYSGSLKSSGSANRWNLRGQNVIYAGSTRSLSTLELFVRRSSIVPFNNYKVVVISIADDNYLFKQIHINELAENWRTLAAYSTLQEIGSKWYISQGSLILKVPSAVIPYEYNYIINTEHPDFTKCVHIAWVEDHFWDNRLF